MADKQENKREIRLAYASILIGAALWGIIGVWNRGLMAAGLSPIEIVTVRNFGGMLLLALVFAARDRSVFRVKREHWKYFAGTGIVSVVLFTACYFSCQKICSLAVASILLYTAPSFVVILSAILWKEPITKRKALALALTLFGCASVCGITETLFSGGNAAGGGDAHYDSMTVTVWTFLFAGPASLLFLPVSRLSMDSGSLSLSPHTFLLSMCLVVFSTVLPYIFYTRGLAKVEAGKASIMASLEPVVASLAGVILFHEPADLWTLCGIVCVLAGVWILR